MTDLREKYEETAKDIKDMVIYISRTHARTQARMTVVQFEMLQAGGRHDGQIWKTEGDIFASMHTHAQS